jgi:putative methyltransferase
MGFFVAGFVRSNDADLSEGDMEDGPYVRDEDGRLVRDVTGMPVLKSTGLPVALTERTTTAETRNAGGAEPGESASEHTSDRDDELSEADTDEWGGFDN